MDPVPIVFYAAVCCALAVAVPQQMPRLLRAGMGAVVGITAALIFPMLRSFAGF